MLVHEHVNRSRAGQEDRYGTLRLAVMKMMNRHCGTIPVVEWDARLNGMVMVREVLQPLSEALGVFFPRFGNTWYWRYDDENNFLSLLDHGLGSDDRLSACRATRCHSDSGDERFNDDQWPEDRISQNR